MSLLHVDKLSASHGQLPAVRGIEFTVDEGEIVALVGANGAGKTTLLRTIAGAHRADRGRVVFDGVEVTGLPAHRRVAAGISLVPEGRRLFPTMSVEENLRVGASAARPGEWSVTRVLDAFPQLQPLRRRRAGELSGGQQQAVAIGRALMANPRILLLDEISLGLSPKAVDGVYASLRILIDARVTLILVEQDLGRTLATADRILCLLEGRIVAAGRADEMSREQVMAHYFGTREAA
ncbi:MAG: ABC transporter ATP-binding protein [Rhodocyclales bacterium]|nr:ABC transporter ATP-binding protein [Rhodocyclales bacterium]